MSASRGRVLWLSPGSLPLGLLQAWARAAGATLREWPPGSAEGDESPADGPADWWLRVLPDTPPDAERPVFEALTADVHHTHLLLHWRQPMWRLLAQAQAAGPEDLSGPSGPQRLVRWLAAEREARLRLARVRQGLQHLQRPRLVMPLDVLADPTASRHAERWQELRDALGLPDTAVAEGVAALQHAIADLRAQDPGLVERARHEAQWMVDLDHPPAFLQPRLTVPEAAADTVLRARLGRMPAALCEGDELPLGGSLVLRDRGPADTLIVRQGARSQTSAWDQPTPVLGREFPQAPLAGVSRFRAVPVRASVRQPVQVQVGRAASADTRTVMDVRFESRAAPPMPGIYLARWGIGYQPLPKVACTTLKELVFRLAHREPFSPGLGGGANHVHRYFDLREQDIGSAAWRFTVVRDPVKRFLSGYSNRVLHHRELSAEFLARQTLRFQPDPAVFLPDPGLDHFIEHLDTYRCVPTIDHHFAPMAELLAPLAAYDRVYAFEELDTLFTDLGRRTGQAIHAPHLQRGGPKIGVSDLGPASLARLSAYYAPDYEWLEGRYAPPVAR